MDDLEQLAKSMNEQCLNRDNHWHNKWSANQLQQDYSDDSYYCCGYGRGAELCDVCKSTLKQLNVYRNAAAMPETMKSIMDELNQMRTDIKTISLQLATLSELVTNFTKIS